MRIGRLNGVRGGGVWSMLAIPQRPVAAPVFAGGGSISLYPRAEGRAMEDGIDGQGRPRVARR